MIKQGLTRRGALIAATASAAACAPNLETPAYEGAIAFNHGVASGDPLHDRVVIWTRVSPERAGPVSVRWIVARNRELSDVVKTGIAETSEARDYTLKADVTGLRPGAPYFYGFRAGAAQSPVGKTRTLPRGRAREAKLAVVSCASYPHGFFNVYAALTAREDIDVVVHLGDYIYEYGLAGFGGDSAIALGRIPAPEVELNKIEDYRQRHAQYKTEPELQAAHAVAPWVVVWDDHEVANDSWSAGAQNHQLDEGAWATRKQAALQAYYEWMPIRDPEPGRAFEAINRTFQFGDLFSLIMVETRLLARTEQLDYARDLPLAMQRWDLSAAGGPAALRQHEPDRPGMHLFPAIHELVGEDLRPVLDWRRAQRLLIDPANLPAGFFLAPDLTLLNARLAAPERALLGEAQEQWLAQQLSGSKQSGVAWQIIGNQVLMAPVDAPDLSAVPPALAAALERLRPGVTQMMKLTRFAFPLNTDSWDGYPAARARVLAAIRAAGGNTLVLTGDTHTAWVNELNDSEGRVAVELGTTSVTSPSEDSYFAAAGIDFAAAVRSRNPQVKWSDSVKHGFLLLTLNKEQARAEFIAVSAIDTKTYDTTIAAAFTIAADEGAGVGAIVAV